MNFGVSRVDLGGASNPNNETGDTDLVTSALNKMKDFG